MINWLWLELCVKTYDYFIFIFTGFVEVLTLIGRIVSCGRMRRLTIILILMKVFLCCFFISLMFDTMLIKGANCCQFTHLIFTYFSTILICFFCLVRRTDFLWLSVFLNELFELRFVNELSSMLWILVHSIYYFSSSN